MTEDTAIQTETPEQNNASATSEAPVSSIEVAEQTPTPITPSLREEFLAWAHDETGKLIREADEIIAWVREHI